MLLSLPRLSGGVPGVSSRLLLDFPSSLTFCSLHSLTRFPFKLQPTFGNLASLLLCGFSDRLSRLCDLTFGQPNLAGGTGGLSSCLALGTSRVICAGLCLETLLHGLAGAVSRAQPVTKALIAEAAHALISLSRTARSVVTDLTRYDTSPVSSAGMSRMTSYMPPPLARLSSIGARTRRTICRILYL
jgi:hypothetical protein